MRIMTTNIWGDYFGNPVDVRENGIYNVYESYKPDVIGFQEITDGWYKSRLFERLSNEYFFVGTELFGNTNYVPMAVRNNYKLIAKGYELLEETPDKSKAITWAVLLDKEQKKSFGVCNVHFWWKQGKEEYDTIREKNAEQLVGVMKYINSRYGCSVFAFGDMNCTRSSRVFKIVYPANEVVQLFDVAEERDLVSSHHGDPVVSADGSYHGEKTARDYNHSIDHIVGLGGDFKVTEYRIVEDQYALDATDHSPVYADIDLR